jgi:transcriptional regulator with XRE-family HTH domain
MPRTLSARYTLVGSLLRQYREDLGYSLDDAADILECDRSRISRIETGKRGIRPPDIRRLLSEYGVDASTQETLIALTRPRGPASWPGKYRTVLGDGYLDFIAAEPVASHISIYAPHQVPDLLQTRAYAEAMAAADITVPGASKALAVEARVTQRATLLHEQHKDLTVVIGEAACRQRVGRSHVLREQLVHLAKLATEYPRIAIHFLPRAVGAHVTGNSGGFSMLQFSTTPTLGLVHLSGPAGGICLDDAAAISKYTKVFNQVSWFALSPEQSVAKLCQLATRYPGSA